MAIELHPGAAENLDDKAERLPAAVVEKPPSGPAHPTRVNPAIAHMVDLSDPSRAVHIRVRDAQGRPHAHYFVHQQRLLGLRADAYGAMRTIVEALANTPQLRELASIVFLEDVIVDWVNARYEGAYAGKMTEFVLPRVEAAVRPLEVLIPLATSIVDKPLRIGRVTLRPLTAEFLESWEQQTVKSVANATPEERARAQAVATEHRQLLQGLTGAVVEVTAEPIRAKEVALSRTEETLGLLRWLSPANQEPTAISFCVVRGRERSEGIEAFFLQQGRVAARMEADTHMPRPEMITSEATQSSQYQTLFAVMTRLLTRGAASPFEAAVLNAFLLYTKNTVTPDLAEKLTYILAALESVLLRDRGEAIQQNLGERIAFLSESDGGERRKVVALVRGVYRLRSEFLHHGQSIDDIETMRTFMKKAHTVMGLLLTRLQLHRTVAEFVDAVDDVKFS